MLRQQMGAAVIESIFTLSCQGIGSVSLAESVARCRSIPKGVRGFEE